MLILIMAEDSNNEVSICRRSPKLKLKTVFLVLAVFDVSESTFSLAPPTYCPKRQPIRRKLA